MPESIPLGELSAREFLRDYWQKKPLFIQNAFPNFESPVSPQELAGLALDEDVESRLVMEKGGAYPWQLHRGPFVEDDFLTLPESHWTLLVQEVDQLLPSVADLRRRFRFIPDWRIDDVMISYAAPQGGVGAHIDNYDVFLLQGLGERRWQISDHPIHDETIVPDRDVRMLADFEEDQEFVARPGDLLYLPPRFAHYGVALNECLTISVGFRAPSRRDLLAGLLDELIRTSHSTVRYTDPDLAPPEHPAEIRPEALDRVRNMIEEALADIDLDRFFGRFTTSLPPGDVLHPAVDATDADQLRRGIENGLALERTPSVRMAFIREGDQGAVLFAAGSEFQTTLDAARHVTSDFHLSNDILRPLSESTDALALVSRLVERGVLRPVDAD